MKKVVITGANGFIGCRLAEYLASRKIQVCCLVQRNTNHEKLKEIENTYILEFDLKEIAGISDPKLADADTVYHLAWDGVSTDQKNNYELQVKNIQYTLDVFRFSQKIGSKNFICPGSTSEYAYAGKAVDGRDVPCPADAYGAAKISARYICSMFATQQKLNFIWALIPSIYGPGRNDNNLITYAIKSLLNKEKPAFTKLEQKWDYLYIDDLIYALYLIGDKGKGGCIYPIGSGEHRTLREYVEIIHDLIDPTLPIGIGELPYKTDRIDNSVMDISLLSEHTGYKPSVTFEKGIKKTIEYFKSVK